MRTDIMDKYDDEKFVRDRFNEAAEIMSSASKPGGHRIRMVGQEDTMRLMELFEELGLRFEYDLPFRDYHRDIWKPTSDAALDWNICEATARIMNIAEAHGLSVSEVLKMTKEQIEFELELQSDDED